MCLVSFVSLSLVSLCITNCVRYCCSSCYHWWTHHHHHQLFTVWAHGLVPSHSDSAAAAAAAAGGAPPVEDYDYEAGYDYDGNPKTGTSTNSTRYCSSSSSFYTFTSIIFYLFVFVFKCEKNRYYWWSLFTFESCVLSIVNVTARICNKLFHLYRSSSVRPVTSSSTTTPMPEKPAGIHNLHFQFLFYCHSCITNRKSIVLPWPVDMQVVVYLFIQQWSNDEKDRGKKKGLVTV